MIQKTLVGTKLLDHVTLRGWTERHKLDVNDPWTGKEVLAVITPDRRGNAGKTKSTAAPRLAVKQSIRTLLAVL